jgi:dipeptidyl aminopeptidase/acylaminoacyl peptidase
MKKPTILPRLASTAMVVMAMLIAVASAALAGLPALIPREVLFGNPVRAQPSISPDGKKLAWIAPDSKNVMQVWVQTIGGNDARMVTADKSRGIRNHDWAWDSHTILYQQDSDGDENYHTYAVDLARANVRDLTPWQGVRAEFLASNPRFPEQLLIAMNLRDRKTMDVYRVNLNSGAVVLDTLNPGDVQGWLADDDLVIRGASVVTPEGGAEIRVRDSAQGNWRTLVKTGAGDLKQDLIAMLDFSKDGRAIFLESTVGRDTAGIVRKDLSSGAETLIARRDDSDLDDAMIHPTRHVIEAAAFAPERKHWQVIDPAVAPDFDALAKVEDGDLSIVSRDLADDAWLVEFNSDRHSSHYYRWDRATRKATLLFSAQPRLDAATLAPMKPITFRARDGMNIHGYLTLPVGLEPNNLPLVENVHGGPWWRYNWGMEPLAQWYANRGYAVLEVNFRGSTGYGKKYLHAGDRQWGLAMQDDLTDSVKWAVAQGIADPKRVAIDGVSYGGYAALAGAAFTPEVYKCAVDICGPADLFLLIKTFPAYYAIRGLWLSRVGDPDRPADKELLTKASPLYSAEQIRIPLLIGQGANDPRVVRSQSDAVVAAIAKNKGQVTYVVYSDEGHGFGRPPNRLDFEAREEKFLASQLGGRYQPMTSARMPGSTAIVKVVGK